MYYDIVGKEELWISYVNQQDLAMPKGKQLRSDSKTRFIAILSDGVQSKSVPFRRSYPRRRLMLLDFQSTL